MLQEKPDEEQKDTVKIVMLDNMFKSDIVAKAVKKLSKEERNRIIFFHTGGKKERN